MGPLCMVSIYKEISTQTLTEERTCEDSEKVAIFKSRREASEKSILPIP